MHHIISYHRPYIAHLKRQNRLKVGTYKPKLKVKMQWVSDDDIRKRLFEKPRFELAAKDVFRLGTWEDVTLTSSGFRQGVSGFWARNRESTATDG